MRPRLPLLFVCAAITALTAGCAGKRAEVRQFGRMHDVLSGGAENARGQVALSDVLERPHAFGVGALAGLEGEITIWDGEAIVARPAQSALRVDKSATSSEQAALLTVAYVDNWQDTTIDQDLSGEQLEQFIAETAAACGLDADQPFPFVIEGRVTDLKLHAIHGECPMRPGVTLTAEQQPWRYELAEPTDATIVGFYAADSVGNLTHPGIAMHAHALLNVDGRELTGHVERMACAAGAVLKLPATP